ncbi:hypothetical protein G7K71_08115 [Desulfofundulus sp. TPOSR]|uniref:hypothetical protein n=1 Tax=Desulfofundulus sp. TPOSR TaxID=2714340 RepID=UPI00140D8033|nr:hypothetical protein [Desulfofundulus sp. TPOSR]NHM26947.1 hypothetical protein [Desulfofundulus sp. TPOSR]
MLVLLAHPDPEVLAGYLRGADHEVRELYVNDLAVQAAVKFGADAVIYSDSLEPVVPHEEALKALLDAGLRVVLLARRDSPLVPYAGALGIRDLVFLPASPAQVLYRLENPASPQEAAELVRGLMVTGGVASPLNPATLAEAGLEPDEAAVGEVEAGEAKRKKAGLLGKLNQLRPVSINQAGKPEQEKMQAGNDPEPERSTPGGEDAVEPDYKPPQDTGSGIPVLNRVVSGTPKVLLGLGSEQLEEWFQGVFDGVLEVIHASRTPEDFKEAVENTAPDIAVLMRPGPAGGIAGAHKLAAWAVTRVPAVLFIAGELDDAGKEMAEEAAGAGVRHILTCPPGGFVSGEELVFLVNSLIRELKPGQAGPATAVQKPEPKKKPRKSGRPERKLRFVLPRVSVKESVPLEEETPEDEAEKDVPLHEAQGKNPASVVPGGLLAVVSPWRPGLAGRIAAQAARMFAATGNEVAFICAAKESTGAVWLDVSDEELIMCDWRVPGSAVPLVRDRLKLWPVDPAKDLDCGRDGVIELIKQARRTAVYTVVDFGGDVSLAGKAVFLGRSVVMCVVPGGDPVELKTALLWFRQLKEGRENVVAGIDLRGVPPVVPEQLNPVLTIRHNPADALSEALVRGVEGEFYWERMRSIAKKQTG